MGIRSYLVYSDLKVKDWEKFYTTISSRLDNIPEWLKAKIDQEKLLPRVIAEKISSDKTKLDSYFADAIHPLEDGDNYNAEGNIWLDFDDWKIQQYWYADFCHFLWLLRSAGLRGTIELDCEDQEYHIMFDKEVKVRLFTQREYDEEGEECINEDEASESELLNLEHISGVTNDE